VLGEESHPTRGGLVD